MRFFTPPQHLINGALCLWNLGHQQACHLRVVVETLQIWVPDEETEQGGMLISTRGWGKKTPFLGSFSLTKGTTNVKFLHTPSTN